MSTPIPCNCGSGFTVCRREPFVCGNLFVENLNAQDVRPQVQDQPLFCEDDDETPVFPEFQDWYQSRYEAQFIYPEDHLAEAYQARNAREDEAYLYSQGCTEEDEDGC